MIPKWYRNSTFIFKDSSDIKMVYLIGPDGLVNRRFANFHKTVWMTKVHPCCFLEICIPSVYRVCRIYQVLSQRASKLTDILTQDGSIFSQLNKSTRSCCTYTLFQKEIFLPIIFSLNFAFLHSNPCYFPLRVTTLLQAEGLGYLYSFCCEWLDREWT